MMSCFQLIDRLKHQNILTPVILMSAKIETDIAMQAINYGVTGFIKRPFQAMELIEKVQTAIDLDRKRSRQTEVAITFHQSRKSLTEREKEILDLLLRNYSSTKVGEILGLSHRTIENHRANIFQKLDLSGTPELIRLATIEETVFALLDLKN